MKAYTDLEQSKKLAEILPLESSDMSYDWFVIGKEYSSIPQCRKFIDDELPCWSLAALLGVLPETMLGKDKDGYVIMTETMGSGLVTTSDNPVDACVEMVLKLNELNLL